MVNWFTSDTHFGHERIIELCNRPFKDVDHMNAEIVKRWNEVVMPEDTVYHLGDVALGRIDESLEQVRLLNGTKILVVGNHDRPFMTRGKARYDEWMGRYQDVFDHVIDGNCSITLGEHRFYMSHFPYDGDSHGDDRYTHARPVEDGKPLIHGHTHSNDVVTLTQTGSVQIHVGVDAWQYSPVSEDAIVGIYEDVKDWAKV